MLEKSATFNLSPDSPSAPTDTMPLAAAGTDVPTSYFGFFWRLLSLPEAATMTMPPLNAALLASRSIRLSNRRRLARYPSSAMDVARSTGYPRLVSVLLQPGKSKPSDMETTFAFRDDAHSMAVEQHVRFAIASIAQHLADQRPVHPRRHADPRAVDGASEYRSRAMGAVALHISVARSSEVPLHQIDPRKGRMIGVDPGVQDADRNVAAIRPALVSPHGRDPPSRPGRRHFVRGHLAQSIVWAWSALIHRIPGSRTASRRSCGSSLPRSLPATGGMSPDIVDIPPRDGTPPKFCRPSNRFPPPSRIGIFQNDVAWHDIAPLRVGHIG